MYDTKIGAFLELDSLSFLKNGFWGYFSKIITFLFKKKARNVCGNKKMRIFATAKQK